MKKISLIYIILSGVFWGTSGIFVHYLAPYGFTSLQMTFFRSVISFVCMLLYILLFDRKLFKASQKELLLFVGSGLGFLGTASCYFYSMQLTSISTAVVLMYTAPIFVMIYSVTFLGEKFTRRKGISVLCMIVGCALVSGIIGGLKFNTVGILMGLMAGVSYSAYNIFTKIQMKNNCNVVTANLYCFLFSAILGFFIATPGDIPGCIAINPPVTIPLIIGMSICTSILPYFLYSMSLRYIPAGTAASLAVVEPMAATLFSVIIFGEHLTVYSVIGITLILGAVFILSRQKD